MENAKKPEILITDPPRLLSSCWPRTIRTPRHHLVLVSDSSTHVCDSWSIFYCNKWDDDRCLSSRRGRRTIQYHTRGRSQEVEHGDHHPTPHWGPVGANTVSYDSKRHWSPSWSEKFSNNGWVFYVWIRSDNFNFWLIDKLNVKKRILLSTSATSSDSDWNILKFGQKIFMTMIRIFYSRIWSENSNLQSIDRLNIPKSRPIA